MRGSTDWLAFTPLGLLRRGSYHRAIHKVGFLLNNEGLGILDWHPWLASYRGLKMCEILLNTRLAETILIARLVVIGSYEGHLTESDARPAIVLFRLVFLVLVV
jgi:hypothetical protein